jgi:hypothetical protein
MLSLDDFVINIQAQVPKPSDLVYQASRLGIINTFRLKYWQKDEKNRTEFQGLQDPASASEQIKDKVKLSF